VKPRELAEWHPEGTWKTGSRAVSDKQFGVIATDLVLGGACCRVAWKSLTGLLR
jgi:hypothetical protein